MRKELSAFKPLDGFDGIYTSQKGTLRCTAIRLRTGGLCLYSPVSGLGSQAIDSLSALGRVTHLLAPNHYHHKGLSEYVENFPNATLCSTEAARPRLQKQTGLHPIPLHEADLHLPKGTILVEPPGLKTGEIWLDISAGMTRLWIVTDAFCGPQTKRGEFSDKPELLGTFPTFGIADRQTYFDWLSTISKSASPTTLLPCHGTIIKGDRLAEDIVKLVAELL